MIRSMQLALALCVVGCESAAPTTGDPARKVTWAEYQSMDAEQKVDPYVVDHLDDEAKANLAAAQRKKRR